MRASCGRAVLAAALIFLASCGQQGAPIAAPAPPDGQAPAFEIERSAVHTVRSTALNRTYDVYVKTPPGYDAPENAGRRYPVIYLNDGPYTFQVASGVTRVPFNQGRLNEFILVGVSYAKGEDPAESRSRDLTPWVDPQTGQPTGGAAAYLNFLKTEVMPLAEGRYRIDPSKRALSGQSYGGLFGLWVALTEPDLFADYILTSPSIWFARRAIFETEAAFAANHKDLKARIYLATGAFERPGAEGCRGCRTDMVADQQRLAKALEARNYPNLQIRSDVIAGTYHETTYPVGLIHGMQWFYLKSAP